MSDGLLSGLMGEPTHRTKRRKIDKNLKSIVWHKYHKGRFTGKCYVCKKPITFDNFEVGHNRARAAGGRDNINNLRPLCRACNSSMGTMSIEVYKAKYFGTRRVKKKKPIRKVGAYHYETDLLGRKYKVRGEKVPGLFGLPPNKF